MTTRELYVIDTCALMSFYSNVFEYADGYPGSPELSTKTCSIINEAIYSGWTRVRISIPSIVFVEIYEKWLRNEEFCRRFFYEVFDELKQSENIEIRPADREILEDLIKLDTYIPKHDLHDRIVLASAMALDAPLITTDESVTEFINEKNIISKVLY